MPLPCVVLSATAPLLVTTSALSRAWDMIAVCTQKSHRAKHLAFRPSGFWKPFTFSCYDKNDNYRLGAPGWSGGFLQIDALLFSRERSWATQNCRTLEKTLRLTGKRSCVHQDFGFKSIKCQSRMRILAWPIFVFTFKCQIYPTIKITQRCYNVNIIDIKPCWSFFAFLAKIALSLINFYTDCNTAIINLEPCYTIYCGRCKLFKKLL